jgi:hypothetical protein
LRPGPFKDILSCGMIVAVGEHFEYLLPLPGKTKPARR